MLYGTQVEIPSIEYKKEAHNHEAEAIKLKGCDHTRPQRPLEEQRGEMDDCPR